MPFQSLTTVRHIFGRMMHSETALCSQWDKGWKNNLLFASPSIRRPTVEENMYDQVGKVKGLAIRKEQKYEDL